MSVGESSGQGSSASGNGAGGQPSGLMYVEFDYPEDELEELHDWYNTEHIPERMSVPGIVTGRRFAAIEGGPRWLAAYELESPAVLETEAYTYCKGPGETPWTRRILLTGRPNYRRSVHELVWSESGEALGTAAAGPPGLFSLWLRGSPTEEIEAGLRALRTLAGVSRVRLYRDLDAPDEQRFLADLNGVWAVQSSEFRQAWIHLALRMREQWVEYSRTVLMLIL